MIDRPLSQLLPTSPRPPKPVASALKRASEMRERLAHERAAVEAAETGIADAQARERERMANQFAAGKTVDEDLVAVTAAEQAHAGAVRRYEAAQLAAADLEAQLREAVEESRDAWARLVDAEVTRLTETAGDALRALEEALTDRAQAVAVHEWLVGDRGLAAGRPVRSRGLGVVPGSSHRAANAQPIAVDETLAWLGVALSPAASRSPPAEMADLAA